MLLLENMALSHECIKKMRRGNRKNNDFLLKSVKIKQLFSKNVSKKTITFENVSKKNTNKKNNIIFNYFQSVSILNFST